MARDGALLFALLFGLAGAAAAQGQVMAAKSAVLADACAQLVMQAEAEQADCGCPPKGCVRTQGYWSNKPGVTWPSGFDRNAPFFSSGLSWQQVMDRPTRGDAYLILAHQYVAAVMNRAAGASAPSGVQSVINGATTWFNSGVTLGQCMAGGCLLQRAWAGVLDTYNNGNYPGAPKHCDET
ncbi:hypothetical protein [Massilia sp. ST3]|uniref:hypothetical protein n=1 Tax=Massilia sp. ST3 TaxID=2824903 RepID=UPI001B81B768|nr:hypothetical protein [Massilia sp. ST3]MBQ5945898.1 hypothetical protein [Massilia sp. ST3]